MLKLSSVQFNIKVDLTEIEDMINRLGNNIDEATEKVVEKISNDATRTSRNMAMERLPEGGGSIANSISWKWESKGETGLYKTNVTSSHEWYNSIEHGTAPHTISAKEGERLSIDRGFPDGSKSQGWGPPGYTPVPQYGTKYVYDKKSRPKSVEHPGARAFHLFHDATEYIKLVMLYDMERLVREALRT